MASGGQSQTGSCDRRRSDQINRGTIVGRDIQPVADHFTFDRGVTLISELTIDGVANCGSHLVGIPVRTNRNNNVARRRAGSQRIACTIEHIELESYQQAAAVVEREPRTIRNLRCRWYRESQSRGQWEVAAVRLEQQVVGRWRIQWRIIRNRDAVIVAGTDLQLEPAFLVFVEVVTAWFVSRLSKKPAPPKVWRPSGALITCSPRSARPMMMSSTKTPAPVLFACPLSDTQA